MMVMIFYVASIIAILATLKVISGTSPFSSLLYLVISLLASAAILYSLGAYFSAILQILLLTCGIAILFLSAISFLKIRKANFKMFEKDNLTPKIWLGPLILIFILFVMLLFSIVNTNYGAPLQRGSAITIFSMGDILLGHYILVVELAVFLILGAFVVSYHFVNLIWHTNKTETAELCVIFNEEKPNRKRKKKKES